MPRRIARLVDDSFQIRANGSTPLQEMRAGLTTFLTMAYILFVNPTILSKAIDLGPSANGFGQILTSTALAAAVGTLCMALVANRPFATAPGMGLNAYFTFSVVLGQGVPWRTALGCVFISGFIALMISVAGIREWIVRLVPLVLKRATGAGIGLFLATIGLMNSGLVVGHPSTLVTVGNLRSPGPLIALFGLFLTATLMVLRVRGAFMVGILAATVLAIGTQAPVYQGQPFSGFQQGFIQAPVWPVDLFMAFDLKGALSLSLVMTIFSMFFVEFFDSAGTLVSLAEKAGFTDKSGNIERGSKAFIADGMATTFGAVAGTSSTTSYIEAMSGIEDGGRTGLTSFTVAMLFLVSMFLWPLAGVVPAVATAPAMILVGALMMTAAAGISWSDSRQSIPAFLTMIAMPLTYSIANGIALGIVAYTILHALTGKAREVHWFMYGLTLILIAKHAYVGVH